MNFHYVFLLICSISPFLCAVIEGRTLGFKGFPPFRKADLNDSLVYLWPLPKEFSYGNGTVSVDPGLSLEVQGNGGNSPVIREAFERYRKIIFKHRSKYYDPKAMGKIDYDLKKLIVIVDSDDENLQLGVDESYSLYVAEGNEQSIIQEAIIEANTIYGALRGIEEFEEEKICKKRWGKAVMRFIKFFKLPFSVPDSKEYKDMVRSAIKVGAVGVEGHPPIVQELRETFSQLCIFNYVTKDVELHKTPWYIKDEPRFPFRGLLLDTSRHYLPIDVIKQVIESMSYAKLNVIHWHIIDEESFPLEVPSFPNLWKSAYTKWERYTIEDAYEIVDFAKMRGINIMAEIDVPGHAESWGFGYPDLWPSESCREPLDVSKNFTFDLFSGIMTDMRKIFPFELFHLGGDEVITDCWNSTPHVKQWLEGRNMTGKDAYQYFVLRAQEIAIAQNSSPVNWEETFDAFKANLNPKTVVHNWLGPGVCPLAVAKGYRCIVSNQGLWYLDRVDVPWQGFYNSEPLEGIQEASQQELVLGGEVCMWGERVDASNVQQTIWPRAAAAAERLWSDREAISTENINVTALPRLQYFRCLLNRRGVPAAPVTNTIAREPPIGPGSCYEQ